MIIYIPVLRIFPLLNLRVGLLAVRHLSQTFHYLDEFEFRFNNRNNPYLFRDTLLRLIASETLEYKELTKAEAA